MNVAYLPRDHRPLPLMTGKETLLLWAVGLALLVAFVTAYLVVLLPDAPLPEVAPSTWSKDRHDALPPVNFNHPGFTETRP